MKVYSGVTYPKDVIKAVRENCIGLGKIMNESECLEKLNKWAKEYLVGWPLSTNESIIFRVEDIDCKTTMGYYYPQTFYSLNGDRREHVVVLDTKLMTFPDYLINSVLWHEFCHMWNRWINGYKVESHGKEFKELLHSNIGYWFGDVIAKFLWGLSPFA